MTDTHTTSHIPDEAVQAAAKRSYEYEGDRKGLLYVGFENEPEDTQEQWRNSVKEAILGALPYLSAPCAIEVKKLEWRNNDGDDYWPCDFDKNFSIDRWWEGSLSYFEVGENADVRHQTIEEAKAAAQADFERRILSCVVTKPVDVPALLQEVRSGERDGFINTGKEPHGNDADLSCPCCGGSGHKDDAKPVDVAAVRRQALEEAEQGENSDIIKKLKDAIAWRKLPGEERHKATLEILERALSAIIAFSVDTSPKNSLNLSNLLRHAFISGFEAKGGTITEAINHWPDYNPEQCQAYERVVRALSAEPAHSGRKYKLGDRLTKTKGSKWTGRVVGFYSTNLTPIGYAIESETETGSVQIYPEAALTLAHSVDAGRAALAQGGDNG